MNDLDIVYIIIVFSCIPKKNRFFLANDLNQGGQDVTQE